MNTVRMNSIILKGRTGALADNISKNWLLGMRERNPAILDMFAERDKLPYRDLLPWSGEFAGKYMTGAYYIYRLTLDRELYDYTVHFADEFITYAGEDGYLGCFCENCHLSGAFSTNPDGKGTWDAWAHYHAMLGLLLWYHETGKQEYYDTVIKAAKLFLRLYYNPENGDISMLSMESTEMNLAILHIFAILYTETQDQRYHNFAKRIEKDLEVPGEGNFINHALMGLEFWHILP